ncbi:MAG: hypothetical protein JW904_15155 [Spirochaetales bacterium]|nr:hypothetical protein [Spirochaetales bacterium]
MKKSIFVCIVLLLLSSSSVFAASDSESLINDPDTWFHIQASAELGFLWVMSHTIQFGNAGTNFDYVADGGQDVLFPFTRYSVELTLFKNHSFTFLYQPLDLATNTELTQPVTVYGTTFAGDTAMDLTYGFTFYRFSYLYYFINDENLELAAGLSLQIRNANIIFASSDGADSVRTDNIGPVPILKVKGRYIWPSGLFIGAEIDGFYASSAIFNGAAYPFEGAIFDANIKSGFRFKNGIEAFMNIRYLGGGAKGTAENPEVGDGYTNNWLHTMSFSIGVTIR